MAMHGLPHPGGIVRRQCLEPLGITGTRAADGAGRYAYDLCQARTRAGETAVERFASA